MHLKVVCLPKCFFLVPLRPSVRKRNTSNTPSIRQLTYIFPFFIFRFMNIYEDFNIMKQCKQCIILLAEKP